MRLDVDRKFYSYFVDTSNRNNILVSCRRLNQEYFLNWRMEKAQFSLLFDKESKGNPGEAIVGGVLFSPEGKFVYKFVWGL